MIDVFSKFEAYDKNGKKWSNVRLVSVVEGQFPLVFAINDGISDTVIQVNKEGNPPFGHEPWLISNS